MSTEFPELYIPKYNDLGIFNNLGRVNFSDVTYFKEGEKIFDNLNLEFFRGDSVCFTGGSEIERKILIDLLTGSKEPSEGFVLVNNHEPHLLSSKMLHQNIGIVREEIHIFAGTVRENMDF